MNSGLCSLRRHEQQDSWGASLKLNTMRFTGCAAGAAIATILSLAAFTCFRKEEEGDSSDALFGLVKIVQITVPSAAFLGTLAANRIAHSILTRRED